MSVLEVNLNSEAYNILSEFLADIFTIQHNVAIFHGSEYQAILNAFSLSSLNLCVFVKHGNAFSAAIKRANFSL